MFNKISIDYKKSIRFVLLLLLFLIIQFDFLFAKNVKTTQNSGFTDDEIMAIYNRNVVGIDNIYLKKVIDNKMDVGTPGLWYLIAHGKDGDWDHDGVKNIDEIEILKDKAGNLYLDIKSDPFNDDSDFDGIKDVVEMKFGLDPLNYTEDEKIHSQFLPTDELKPTWFQNFRVTLSNRFFGVDELSEVDILENHLLNFLDSEMNGINVEVVDKVASSIENSTDLYELANEAFLSDKLDEVKIISEISNITKDTYKKIGKEVLINKINCSNELLDYLIKNGSRESIKKAAKNVKKILSDEKENLSYTLESISAVAVDKVKDELLDLLVDKSAEYAVKKLAKESLYKMFKEDIGTGWKVGYFIFKKTFKETIDNATDDALEALLYCDLGNAIFNYYSNLFYETKVNDSNMTYKYYTLKDTDNVYNILDTCRLLKHWLEGHKALLRNLSMKTKHTIELEKEEENTVIKLEHAIQYFESYADKMVKRNEYLKSVNNIRNNNKTLFDNDYESKIELIHSNNLDNSNKRNVFIFKDGKYYYIDINGDLLKNTVIVDTNGFCYESNDKGEVTVSENVAGAWEPNHTGYDASYEAFERFNKQFTEDGYTDIIFLHKNSENKVKELDIEKKYNELIEYEINGNFYEGYAKIQGVKTDDGNIFVRQDEGGYDTDTYVMYYKSGNIYNYLYYFAGDIGEGNVHKYNDFKYEITVDNDYSEKISDWEFWLIEKKFEELKSNSIKILLDYYDKFNLENGAFKLDNGSYMIPGARKSQIPAVFDSAGNLWCCRQETDGVRSTTFHLIIKFLNGNDSREYFSVFSDGLRVGESYEFYDSAEAENMFKMYYAIKDEYLKFKQ